MANVNRQSGQNVIERLINYMTDRYALLRAVIPYNSSETELFTAANPGNVDAGDGVTISQTPTITAGAYSAGDAVGGLLTFANAARTSGGGGFVKNVLLVDDAGQDAQLELWLFDQTFTAIADNAAWAPTEADLENLIAIVSTVDGTWRAAGTPSAISVEASLRYDLTGTSLFGQLVTRGTPTFAATDDVTTKAALMRD